MRTGTFECLLDIGDEDDVPVTVEWEGYYEPARGMGCAWEDSSPAEGEMDVTAAYRADNGKIVRLTPNQLDCLTEQAWEDYHDQN